jgi:hypothetical protein
MQYQYHFRESVMKFYYRTLAGALALGLAGAALAAGELPPLQTFGGVGYITGGVGEDEFTAIKQAEKDFALSLLFVQTKRGEFVADVKVNIRDKSGKPVLETVSDGPLLLVKLPPGVYKVNAEYDGNVLAKSVRVDAKGVARAAFVWQPMAKATIE